MSYRISLVRDGQPVEVKHHTEGAIITVSGSELATMNITYNYAEFYYRNMSSELGIRWLYGKKASRTIARLISTIEKMGTEQDKDYWKSTPGNAGHALSVLLKWAKQHPDAVWEGD